MRVGIEGCFTRPDQPLDLTGEGDPMMTHRHMDHFVQEFPDQLAADEILVQADQAFGWDARTHDAILAGEILPHRVGRQLTAEVQFIEVRVHLGQRRALSGCRFDHLYSWISTPISRSAMALSPPPTRTRVPKIGSNVTVGSSASTGMAIPGASAFDAAMRSCRSRSAVSASAALWAARSSRSRASRAMRSRSCW